ncbi:hypothetical protein K3495_g12721 [Podosphaera aphanis]|nr:hypothetical protein K3495_g12721 [Podosphaera aphanis]
MSEVSFSSANDFINHIHGLDAESRRTLISNLFDNGVTFREQTMTLTRDLESSVDQNRELSTLNSRLQRELSDCRSSIIELQRTSAVDQYRLTESEKKLEDLLADLPNQGGHSTLPKSEIFKIDVKFTGEDRLLYPSFQRQIRIALAQNADRYRTLQSQISLIYQNFGAGPKSFLDRYLTEDGLFNFGTLKEVWNVLDVSYSNPNEEEEARGALSRLRQTNRPFGAFLSEFQRLQNLSGISDCKTLISYMRSGVSNELRSCISQHQELRKNYTFDEFVALCKDCVLRLDLEKPGKTSANLTLRGLNPTPPRAVPTVPPVSGANAVPMGGDPMILDKIDLSHIGPDGHITPEERQRRYRFKLCMRCGKPGHRRDQCRGKGKEVSVNLADIVESDSEGDEPGPSTSLNV